MNNLLLDNPAKGPGAKIYFCKVVRFLPSSNTVDVVTIDNNISISSCLVACSIPAGFAYGTRYFPTHDDNNSEVEYINSAGDIYCVAAFIDSDYNNAVVLGFLFPLETTLSIAEYGLYIFRHESDVIWMVRGDGTMQIYHPSGSIIKIGDNNTNEVSDTIEKDGIYPAKTDGLYIRPPADYNKSKTTNLFIDWYQGQKVTLNSDGEIILQTRDSAATITMTPDGKVTVQTTEQINAITKDINITASGNVLANVEGYANVISQNATVYTQDTASVHAVNLAKIEGEQGVEITSTFGTVIIHGAAVSVKADTVVAVAGANTNGLSNTPSNRRSTWT